MFQEETCKALSSKKNSDIFFLFCKGIIFSYLKKIIPTFSLEDSSSESSESLEYT